MPTGYTDKIYNGVPQTFEEFALDCARAFGALVTLREERNAEISDSFEPSSYHQKGLDQALTDYEWAVYASDTEIKELLDRLHNKRVNRYKAERIKRDEVKARYEAMLAEVKTWKAPTKDHFKYRDFMIDQLEGSIKSDCSDYYDNDPELLSIEDFRAEELDHALWSLNYHWKMHNEEIKRAQGRTDWIQALRTSLK